MTKKVHIVHNVIAYWISDTPEQQAQGHSQAATMCGILLYAIEIYVTVIGLINKLTGQYPERVSLGRRTRLRSLEIRRTELEESPARQGKGTGCAR